MTRKNIDLQLQSLELLVSKYGVLSPALRNQDSSDASSGDNGEDDFLQVVIRYCDENDIFQSTNSATTPPSPTPPFSSTIQKAFRTRSNSSDKKPQETAHDEYDKSSPNNSKIHSEKHDNFPQTTSKTVVSESALSPPEPEPVVGSQSKTKSDTTSSTDSTKTAKSGVISTERYSFQHSTRL
jgi:hypothetical protein